MIASEHPAAPRPTVLRGSFLEKLVTHPGAFALTTATNTQRAICRCLDGVALGELANDPEVQWAFTGKTGPEALYILAKLPVGQLPFEVILCAAIRGAKTLISSALAFKACITVDISKTRPNESVRYSIAATDMEKARVAIEHLMSTIPEAPLLRPFFLHDTKSGVVIRHPSGRPIEIRVIVAGRGGAGIISRWSAGLTADEAARMQGIGRTVNLPDLLRAAHARILPGGQIFMPGSPWQPSGPIFDAVQDEWGKPSRRRVVIRATGPMLHPSYWTPEKIADERSKVNGELIVQTECFAEFGNLPSQFFTSEDIKNATRPDGMLEMPFDSERAYAAFMDPATRGNAWTLVIASCLPGDKEAETVFEFALVKEWIGSKSDPLRAKRVFAEMKPILEKYRLYEVWSDQHNYDSNKEHAEEFGITLSLDEAPQKEKDNSYLTMRDLIINEAPPGSSQKKRLSLPPDPTFRADMLAIVKELTRTGLRFPLPITGDGRHADYAPSAAGAVRKVFEAVGNWATHMRRVVKSETARRPSSPREATAKRLAAARAEAMITIEELAARTGRDTYLLQMAEMGSMNVNEIFVKDVLRACGLSEHWTPGMATQVSVGPDVLIEVVPWSTEPQAIEALTATISSLRGGRLIVVDGRYYVPDGFVAWACEKQGYVKDVIKPT